MGINTNTGHKQHSLIKFQLYNFLAEEIDSDHITSVTYSIYNYTSSEALMSVYQMDAYWVDWINWREFYEQQLYNDRTLDSNYTLNGNDWNDIDLTTLMKGWVKDERGLSGGIPNEGIMLDIKAGTSGAASFVTQDSDLDVPHRPTLTIEYSADITDPNAVENISATIVGEEDDSGEYIGSCKATVTWDPATDDTSVPYSEIKEYQLLYTTETVGDPIDYDDFEVYDADGDGEGDIDSDRIPHDDEITEYEIEVPGLADGLDYRFLVRVWDNGIITDPVDALSTTVSSDDYTDPNPAKNVEVLFVANTDTDGNNIGTCDATVTWEPATDNPIGNADGIKEYQLLYTTQKIVDYTTYEGFTVYDADGDGNGELEEDRITHVEETETYEVVLPDLADSRYYTFLVRAWDNAVGTRESEALSSTYYVPDYTDPTTPESVSVMPNKWTNDTSPVVAWSGIERDRTMENLTYQYSLDYPLDESNWKNIGKTYQALNHNIITNADFANGTTNWQSIYSSSSVTDNILTNTLDGTSTHGYVYQATTTPVVNGDDIYVDLRVRVTNDDCNEIKVQLDGSTGGVKSGIITITDPIKDKWYDVSGWLKTSNDFTGNYDVFIYHYYDDETTANGSILQIDGSNDNEINMMNASSIFDFNSTEQLRIESLNTLENSSFEDGTDRWESVNSSNSVASNILTNTGDGSSYYSYIMQTSTMPIVVGNDVFISMKVRVTNPDCNKIEISIAGSDSTNLWVVMKDVNNPVQDQWYNVSGTVEMPTGSSGYILLYVTHYYDDAATASGNSMEIDGSDPVTMIDFTNLYNSTYDENQHNMVKNPTFSDGTTSWEALYSTNTVSNNMLSNTITSQDHGRIRQVTDGQSHIDSEIYANASVRVTNPNCKYIELSVASVTGSLMYFERIWYPNENEWYDMGGVLDVIDNYTGLYEVYAYHYYDDVATASGKVMQIDGSNGYGYVLTDISELLNVETNEMLLYDAYNIITNDNFENGTDNWTSSYSSNSVTSNIMTNTLNGSSDYGYSQQITTEPVVIGDNVYVKARVRVTNPNCTEIKIRLDGSIAGSSRTVTKITNPISNQWYDLSGVFETPDDFDGTYKFRVYHEYVDAATANGKQMEVDGGNNNKVLAINLTDFAHASHESSDYNNLIYNSDFRYGTTGWGAWESDNSVSNNTLINTADGTSYRGYSYQHTSAPVVIGNKILVHIRARVTNDDCNEIKIKVDGTDGGSSTTITEIIDPEKDKWYEITEILETPAGFTGTYSLRVYHYYDTAAIANGKQMEIDGTKDNKVRLYDLNDYLNGLIGTNNLLANPNFEDGTTGWNTNNTSNTVTDNVLSSTMTQDWSGFVGQYNINVASVIDDYMYLNLKIRVTNSDSNELEVKVVDSESGEQLSTKRIFNPVADQWYDINEIVKIPDDFEGDLEFYVFQYYPTPALALGKTMEVKAGDLGEIILTNASKLFDSTDIYSTVEQYGSIDLSSYNLDEGQHTIYVRAEDAAGNIGDYEQTTYLYDKTAPTIIFSSPAENQAINGIIDIRGSVVDVNTHSTNTISWELTYGEGESPSVYTKLDSGVNGLYSDSLIYQLDMDSFDDGVYTLKLDATDSAGNTSSNTVQVIKTEISTDVAPQLNITNNEINEPVSLDEDVNPIITESNLELDYEESTNSSNILTNGAVYVDGDLVDGDDSDGLDIDFLNYDEGSTHYVYVQATDTDDSNIVKYSSRSYNATLNDAFEDSVNVTLSNTVHDDTNDIIKLVDDSGSYNSNGTVITYFADTAEDNVGFNGKIDNIILTVSETKPSDTDIIYDISIDDGQTWTLDVTLGVLNNFTSAGDKLKIRATLIPSTDNTETPELSWWQVQVHHVNLGQPFKVQMVAQPSNVTALPNVNYKTLIRWEFNEGADDIRYNVYRSIINDFSDLSATGVDQIGSAITDKYYSDHNINYDTKYYYTVTAEKNMGTPETPVWRESIAAIPEEVIVMAENEFDKRLGTQQFWKYIGFSTGSGSGQIELSQGNLSYNSTDFVMPGPMFVMAMRRTYNSQSTVKTALGHGFDFSFNTVLLNYELDTDDSGTSDEFGVLLKDGDGTIHKFVENGSVYTPPAGLFIDITHQEYQADPLIEERWFVERKDGIKYVYDGNMKLLSLEDRNGNYLSYTYDLKGNIDYINDNANNTIYFEYNNDDLITKVKAPAGTAGQYRAYIYSYENERLVKCEFVIEDSNGNVIHDPGYEESFEYDSNGYLEAITDGEDHVTTLTYDTGGVATQVEYPISGAITESYELDYDTDATSDYTDVVFYGNSTKYRYNTGGSVTSITSPIGTVVNYEYYSHRQIDKVYYDNYIEDDTTTTNIVNDYDYDLNKNISIVEDPEGNTTTFNYMSGQTYNPFDKPYSMKVESANAQDSITTSFTYDSYGNILTMTDPESGVTTNVYYTATWSDTTGTRGYPGQLKTTTDRFGNVTTYEYNQKGWLSKTTNELGYVTTYTYDGMGNPILVTDAESDTYKTEYDIFGRRSKSYYPNESINESQKWIYNNNHNIISYTTGEDSRDKVEVLYEYDDMNRMIKTKVREGDDTFDTVSTMDYSYFLDSTSNKYHSKVTSRDASLIESVQLYDDGGRLYKTYMQDGIDKTNITQYTYDNIGNVVQVVDGEGRTVEAEYDILNRSTKTVIDPGDATHLNYTSSTVYDYLGQVKNSTNGEGETTSYTYDDYSRLKTVTQSPDGGTTDYVTTYDYDEVDGDYIYNQIEDAEGGVKRTYFDEIGRVYKEFNDGTNEDTTDKSIESFYTYDNVGRLIKKEFNDNTILQNVYDDKGYLIAEKYFVDESAYQSDTYSDYNNYIYDTRGNVLESSGINSGTREFEYNWSYDKYNNVIMVTENGEYDTLEFATSQMLYTYKNNGQLKSIKYPGHKTLLYEYDGYGRLEEVIRQYYEDDEFTSDTARKYFYDDSSMIESTNTYLEFSTTESYMEAIYNYDNAGMATDITYLLDGTTQKEKYSYEYNDNGMITKETLLGYEKTVAEQTVINHTYDDIGRLTLSSSVTESITTTYGYDYDKVGNRDQQVITIDGTAFTTNYDYDELYQLDNAIMVNGEKLSYLYDSLGRMSEQLLESSSDDDIEKQSYAYYDNGRLKTVTVDDLEGTNDDIVDNYMYNAQGKRLIKDTDGEITKYLYSGGSVIMELDEDNTRLVENIVDISGVVIASRKRNGTEALKWDFYQYDIRRSTTSIISYDGTKQATYEYDAFGNIIDSELIAGVSNEITYTSARSDGETGLYYMHGRYYNSNVGRFLTQDSYKGSAYEPWTQNLYTYTGNNPVNFTDPTGHYTEKNGYYDDGYDEWISGHDLPIPDPPKKNKKPVKGTTVSGESDGDNEDASSFNENQRREFAEQNLKETNAQLAALYLQLPNANGELYKAQVNMNNAGIEFWQTGGTTAMDLGPAIVESAKLAYPIFQSLGIPYGIAAMALAFGAENIVQTIEYSQEAIQRGKKYFNLKKIMKEKREALYNLNYSIGFYIEEKRRYENASME